MKVYLDNSATTRQYDEVTDAMTEVMRERFGNPSSLHTMGLEAEKAMKAARKSVSGAIGSAFGSGGRDGAGAGELYFTSGGTESDNAVLFGVAKARQRMGKKIITTAVEHPAVLEPARALESAGFQVEYVGVDSRGVVKVDELKSALTKDTVLVSVMAVNNETGTIMPLEEIAAAKEEFNRASGAGILLHSDAVQAFGKIPLRLDKELSGVDFLSLSAHKIHGPKGIGGLWVRKGVNLPSLIFGGGQEGNFRSGTENTPAIVGFGLAAQMGGDNFGAAVDAMRQVKKHLLEGIRAEIRDVLVNGPENFDEAAPSVLNVSFLGTRGEVILHTLEEDGIYVSTGSACSSNKKGMSHVLKAMGLKDKEIEGAIRFSFSAFNTISEMDYVLEKLKQAVERFRRLGTFR